MATSSRLLRTHAGIELWQIESAVNGQKRPAIRYTVKSAGREQSFDRPHEAWQYFQQLTDLLDRDVRPDPPPIDPDKLDTTKPRKRRRRRPRSPAD